MNAQTGYLADIVASLLEADVGVSRTEVVSLVERRIVVAPRSGPHDALTKKVASMLELFFGRVRMPTWRGERRILMEHTPPAGSANWQINFTTNVLRPLAVLNTVVERDQKSIYGIHVTYSH